jgi:hypothetical protein
MLLSCRVVCSLCLHSVCVHVTVCSTRRCVVLVCARRCRRVRSQVWGSPTANVDWRRAWPRRTTMRVMCTWCCDACGRGHPRSACGLTYLCLCVPFLCELLRQTRSMTLFGEGGGTGQQTDAHHTTMALAMRRTWRTPFLAARVHVMWCCHALFSLPPPPNSPPLSLTSGLASALVVVSGRSLLCLRGLCTGGGTPGKQSRGLGAPGGVLL